MQAVVDADREFARGVTVARKGRSARLSAVNPGFKHHPKGVSVPRNANSYLADTPNQSQLAHL